jgi:hypothetical protein
MNFTAKLTPVRELWFCERKKMPRIIRASVALIGLPPKQIVSGWASKPDPPARSGTNAFRHILYPGTAAEKQR